jgi:phosphoribosyl-ATP pyrophosphohydrolase
VVVDESDAVLGLVWSNRESVRQAVSRQRGIYHSRRRGLWVKGESSGDTQDLLRLELDCDRDALRFRVRQHGRGFCHTGSRSCWGEGRGLHDLERRLQARQDEAPPESYTRRLLEDPALLGSKLREEARELVDAETRGDVVHEAADVLYFTLVQLMARGVPLHEVESELDRRGRRIRRSGGDAKPKEDA